MAKHRNPRPKVSKRPLPDNPDVETGVLIRLLYDDLVEVEALAVTADEAVTQLPPMPGGKYGRTLARLYTLVGKTSGRAQGALTTAVADRPRRTHRHVTRLPVVVFVAVLQGLFAVGSLPGVADVFVVPTVAVKQDRIG